MNIDNYTTQVVFQGECAAVKYSSELNQRIKTSIPSRCTVVTLYNEEKQVAVMAHIDDYTSVRSVFNKIELILRKKFEMSLTAIPFTAKVIGGTEEQFSKLQKDEVLKCLAALHIQSEEISLSRYLSKRPQIDIQPKDGQVNYNTIDDMIEFNGGMEYQQLREYGDFNTLLDTQFENLRGIDIPFFEAKEASRQEKSLPQIPCLFNRTIQGLSEKGRFMEQQGLIKLELLPTRVAIESQDRAKLQVKKLVERSFSTYAPIVKSLVENQYALMLRQAALDPNCYELFALLLKHASALPIDLTSRGGRSGSVWDVALASNNVAALQLLNTSS